MKKIKQTITFVILLLHYNSFCQIAIDTSIIASYDTLNQIYKFKANLNLSINDITQNHKSNFRLQSNINTLYKTEERYDSLIGKKFYRFMQLYNNIPVEKSMFNIIYNSQQNPVTANGNIYKNINVNTVPTISGSQAINFALSAVPATTYYWQDSTMQTIIKQVTMDSLATYYPIAELIILPITNLNQIIYYLAYKVRIGKLDSINEVVDVYLNANSGSILYKNKISSSCFSDQHMNECLNEEESANNLKSKNNSFNVDCSTADCQQGSANLHKYGSQYIYTDKFKKLGDCKYRLKDNCTGTTLYTRKATTIGSNFNGSVDIIDNTNVWTNGGDDRDGATAHWCMEKSHEYYINKFGRNGWDGSNSQANLFTNNPGGGQRGGGLFNGSAIFLTKQGSQKQHPLVFLDCVGHEFTHGMAFNTAKLHLGGQEAKAINEGFGDIFGTMIEFYTIANYNTGQNANYLFAELTSSNGSEDRNLSDPNNVSDPDTYNGAFWSTSTNDDAFSHDNNGVLNFWFYLLAEGGSGNNDINSPYCVVGLGKDKASQIAWTTLTTKLTPATNYSNCRALSISAAEDLYGINSNEVAQVTAAWYAVGVGANFVGQVNTQNLTINNSQYDIHYNAKVSLQNVTLNNGPLYVTSNTEIELLPNINLNNGSFADLYIAPSPCVSGARFGNLGNQNNNSSSNQSSIELESNNKESTTFLIVPNPTNGFLKIETDNTLEYPKQIIIRDIMGRNVKIIDNPSSFEAEFNIENEKVGIYMISIYYSDKVISKKIIKQ